MRPACILVPVTDVGSYRVGPVSWSYSQYSMGSSQGLQSMDFSTGFMGVCTPSAAEALPRRDRLDIRYAYSNISLTGIRQPGTTSLTSRVSDSDRAVMSVSERWTLTVRLRGFTTTTASVPASSQSATFSSTSV